MILQSSTSISIRSSSLVVVGGDTKRKKNLKKNDRCFFWTYCIEFTVIWINQSISMQVPRLRIFQNCIQYYKMSCFNGKAVTVSDAQRPNQMRGVLFDRQCVRLNAALSSHYDHQHLATTGGCCRSGFIYFSHKLIHFFSMFWLVVVVSTNDDGAGYKQIQLLRDWG